MNRIKKFWTNHKQKQQKQIENEENSAFNIIEKNGKIYVTVGSRAIKTVKENTTVKEIIELLTECREAQLNYIKK